jgi:hypothetical protein
MVYFSQFWYIESKEKSGNPGAAGVATDVETGWQLFHSLSLVVIRLGRDIEIVV